MKETGNTIADKSFEFAVRIVNLYKYLCNTKNEYVLSKQLLRCGTSIGANVSEALQGQSKKDFLAKMSIALKEASETEYWLKLLMRTEYLDEKQFNSLIGNCEEVKKLLHAIVKSTAKSIEN
jgi:four helix bundle protein